MRYDLLASIVGSCFFAYEGIVSEFIVGRKGCHLFYVKPLRLTDHIEKRTRENPFDPSNPVRHEACVYIYLKSQ